MPFNFTNEYSDPLEFILEAVVFGSLGVCVLGKRVHIFTTFLWMIWRIYASHEGHSGIEIPWSPVRIIPGVEDNVKHDFHHSHFDGAYASYFGWWDGLVGAEDEYKMYMLKKY